MRKGEIEGRLDPNFYLPIFRVSDRNLFRTLNEVTTYILHPPEYPRAFSESGFQLIRSQNVRPLGINLHENPVFFSAEFLKNKKVVFAQIGDVLIVRSGVNAGDVAVVQEELKTTIIGADTLLCKCKSNFTPKFLQVYFYTDFGKRQILRHTTGATNKHLNSENLKKVLVPNLSLESQKKAIGLFDKGLKVKYDREVEARQLLDGIDAYLLERLSIKTFAVPETERFFYRKLSEVTGSRFDANSYHAERLAAIEAVKAGSYASNKLKFLTDFSKTVVSETNLPYVGLENIESNTGNFVERLEKESFGSAVIFKKNQILFPKLRPYLNKVYYAEFDGVCSTEFHILDSKSSSLTNAFLADFLRSQIIVSQTKRLMSGNTLPRLQTEDIENLLIPLPPLKVQEEITAHIQTIRERAKELEREARAEVERAKAEVERMILGEASADA